MFKHFQPPPAFSVIRRGNAFLLIADRYKDALLEEEIEDLKSFLKKHQETIRHLTGRTPHPSVALKDGKRIVVRSYSHGGVLRYFTRNLYLFGSRSFQELALTEEVRSCGIPTNQPVAAVHRLTFPLFYQACILSLEVPQAANLMQYFQTIPHRPSSQDLILKRRTIRSCGLLLKKFHQAGFFHADLQLKNILIADDQPLLIDFDRSYRRPNLSLRDRIRNLLRLYRSVQKWKRLGLPVTRTDALRFFQAYSDGDVRLREALRKSLRTYSFGFILHRCGWSLKGIWNPKRFGGIP